jgi:hypothetical protein
LPAILTHFYAGQRCIFTPALTPVDGLGADSAFHGVQLHSSGNLFRRPSHGEAVFDMIAKVDGALDLRATQFAHPGPAVSAIRAIIIDAPVSGDLPVDRPSMPTKSAGDLASPKAHFHQAAQAASFVK